MLNNLLLGQTAEEKLYVEDVFSTYLYTGNDGGQTITNGIDLSTKGGLVWIKSRSGATSNAFIDTVRGTESVVYSNSTASADTKTGLALFNSDGFDLNYGWPLAGSGTNTNVLSTTYASWTFRKAPKFFDVVTWSGNSTNRTISHALGSVPGMIIVKRTDSTADWQVYHRNLANTEYMVLNTTAAKATGTTRWDSTTATNTVFSLGTDSTVNATGGSYVAYLFAHDTTSDGVIQCGSFTTDASANPLDVNLGWEPQFILYKSATATAAGSGGWWRMVDNVRGLPSSSANDKPILFAQRTDAETTIYALTPTSTGFSTQQALIANCTYIYMAIRRGPMRVPTDATKVFMPTVYTGTNADNRLINTTIAPDTVWIRQRNSTTVGGMVVGDRLRGQPYLLTGTTAAEVNDADSFDQQLVSAVEYGTAFSSMNGVWVGNDAASQLNASTTASNQIVEAFKRAPGFHDVVCYLGTGSSRTVNHNLGVAPELMIFKDRNGSSNWAVYSSALGATKAIYLSGNGTPVTSAAFFNDTAPTASVFTVNYSGSTNESGFNYVAYLFASCPGVSKVGSYTGTGTTQQINCGFTSGARFVLIKRTDSTGDWYVYDSARGIVAGNDPYLLLNSTAAQVTNTDYIDPLSTGFELSSTAPAELNANGGTYIYLAIA